MVSRTKLYLIVMGMCLLIMTYQIHSVFSASERQAFQKDLYAFIGLVESGRYQTAGKVLDDSLLFRLKTLDKDLHEQKLAFMEDVFLQTKHDLNDISINQQEKVQSARTFILMVSPIISSENSLFEIWKHKTKEAIWDALESHTSYFQEKFVHAANLYTQILPSLVIQRPLDEWSLLMDIQSQSVQLMEQPDPEYQEAVLYDMLASISKISHEKPEEENQSFLWMILSVGGLIILTLIYASWKKYKGEIKHKPDKKVDSDHKSD
ncbi:MAG: hypothetical protein H0Z32_00790 [Bacillaceae bacterium]|nr:hypothetical protein [Bacillaceae bacterium]